MKQYDLTMSPALKKLSVASKLAPYCRSFFKSYEGKTFFEKKVLPLKLPFPKNFSKVEDNKKVLI